MKIHVNYDLMEQINIANKGLKLQTIANYVLGIETFNFSMFTCMDYICLPNHEIMWKSNFIRCLLGFAEITSFLVIIMNMLKEAELVQTNYNLKLNDKSIPVLKQDKYIKIPVVNGMGKRFEETLYQEHIIGTKSYDLSVKEPDKKVQVKRVLVKQM